MVGQYKTRVTWKVTVLSYQVCIPISLKETWENCSIERADVRIIS